MPRIVAKFDSWALQVRPINRSQAGGIIWWRTSKDSISTFLVKVVRGEIKGTENLKETLQNQSALVQEDRREEEDAGLWTIVLIIHSGLTPNTSIWCFSSEFSSRVVRGDQGHPREPEGGFFQN